MATPADKYMMLVRLTYTLGFISLTIMYTLDERGVSLMRKVGSYAVDDYS